VIAMLLRLAVATVAALCVGQAAAQSPAAYAGRADVQAFVEEMVARHGFARGELDAVFVRVRHQASIVRAMTPQVKGTRSWQQYRARFVNPQRIEGGVAFWARHERVLDRAAAEYGVPPEMIVAIIGVETEYGRVMGDYRVADALTTLAFDYPRRADYFRGELEQFLLMSRETRTDPLAARGSYAGALGLPQFMPGSFRRYAVDFDGDGRRDLRGSPTDAIGSVANFLVQHGWKAGEPVAVTAALDSADARALADGGVETTRTAGELRIAGVAFDPAVADETATVLIELDSTDADPVFWVGFDNFYVVTRYNRSSFYAASVLELAQALRAARVRP
jgi:membrane-bound lytic murein transglycosylase B